MKPMNMIEALNSAHDVMMARDENIVVMGEDVGYFGGVFRATAGLQKKHGKTRVFDTPINECGIIGVAVGMITSYYCSQGKNPVNTIVEQSKTGTATNIIPDRATIEGTVRTLSPQARKLVRECINRRCPPYRIYQCACSTPSIPGYSFV